MHNGAFSTLEEVVDFYDKGGGRGIGLDVPNQTLPSDSLRLTSAEKLAVVAFMYSLTDSALLTNVIRITNVSRLYSVAVFCKTLVSCSYSSIVTFGGVNLIGVQS
jgi:hypothetical protein